MGVPPGGNSEIGEAIFKKKCSQCHTAQKGGKNLVGPNLFGIVGRKSGQVEGYTYSQANKEKGVIWTPEVLNEYLENPRAYIPGTKMVFAGLKKAMDRADIIAYLSQLK